MKNQLVLFLFLVFYFFSFYSCDDNKEAGADLSSKVTIKQDANGESDVCKLANRWDIVNYTTKITFENKPVDWNSLTFEYQLDPLYIVEKGSISVTNVEGKRVNFVDIVIESNKVVIDFEKVNDQYSYISGVTYLVKVPVKLRDGISKEDLNRIMTEGIKTEGILYVDNQSNSIKSNRVVVKIDSGEATYNIKGDPRNNDYKYKLNVVYFVPLDVDANEGYRERISTLLLKHQLYVCKWMKYWGYEEKSFGLPLAENGMVDIVEIKGEFGKKTYQSSGTTRIRDEVIAYYGENGLKFQSEHSLVITAINDESEWMPFRNHGKWVFSVDYPGMSYDSFNIDPVTNEVMSTKPLTSSLIGQMYYYLGIAMRGEKAEPTYSQSKDFSFGTTLMGGKDAYGKEPTFIDHGNAAIFNICQISSFKEMNFYDDVPTYDPEGYNTVEDPVFEGSNVIIRGAWNNKLMGSAGMLASFVDLTLIVTHIMAVAYHLWLNPRTINLR